MVCTDSETKLIAAALARWKILTPIQHGEPSILSSDAGHWLDEILYAVPDPRLVIKLVPNDRSHTPTGNLEIYVSSPWTREPVKAKIDPYQGKLLITSPRLDIRIHPQYIAAIEPF